MNITVKAKQSHNRQKQFSNGPKILSPDWMTLGSTAAILESHRHLHSTLFETSSKNQRPLDELNNLRQASEIVVITTQRIVTAPTISNKTSDYQ